MWFKGCIHCQRWCCRVSLRVAFDFEELRCFGYEKSSTPSFTCQWPAETWSRVLSFLIPSEIEHCNRLSRCQDFSGAEQLRLLLAFTTKSIEKSFHQPMIVYDSLLYFLDLESIVDVIKRNEADPHAFSTVAVARLYDVMQDQFCLQFRFAHRFYFDADMQYIVAFQQQYVEDVIEGSALIVAGLIRVTNQSIFAYKTNSQKNK